MHLTEAIPACRVGCVLSLPSIINKPVHPHAVSAVERYSRSDFSTTFFLIVPARTCCWKVTRGWFREFQVATSLHLYSPGMSNVRDLVRDWVKLLILLPVSCLWLSDLSGEMHFRDSDCLKMKCWSRLS
jgi:hypothetical protein